MLPDLTQPMYVVLIPFVLVCAAFFLFAWLSSRKPKAQTPVDQVQLVEQLSEEKLPASPVAEEAGSTAPPDGEVQAAAPAAPLPFRSTLAGWWRPLRASFAPAEGVEWFGGHSLAARTVCIELGLVALVVFGYCMLFLDLGTRTILPGNETGLYQSLDLIFTRSIQASGQLPIWNPYYFTGIPMVGNPMFHSFNPVVSIPVLLFGIYDGFKIAVALSFLIGALGMWYLGAVLGMGPVARVWLALMFAFAGQPTARFFQGEYLFVFGWSWIPWALAGMIALQNTRRKLYLAITVLALALIFFSGNAYYAYYMVFVVALLLLALWLDFSPRLRLIPAETARVVVGLLAGGLAIGLIAVQLFPTIQLWPNILKGQDLAGSQSLQQIILDFLSKNSFRPDAYSVFPAREEFYAYLGFAPFLVLLLLPFCLPRLNRRIVFFCVILIAFSVMWIDIKDMPWVNVYTSIRFFAQFRHPVRMILFVEIGILILAGYCLDQAVRWGWREIHSIGEAKWRLPRRMAAYLALAVLLALVGFSIWDLYTTNQPYTRSVSQDEPTAASLQQLRALDRSTYYTRRNPNNGGYQAAIESNLRLLKPWYSFDLLYDSSPVPGQRPLIAQPNYVVQPLDSQDNPVPAAADLVGKVDIYGIYHLRDSLPFAFTVPNDVLNQPSPDPVKASEVIPLPVYQQGTNGMELILNGDAGTRLVLLTANFPGWQAWIDGKPQSIQATSGYLGISVLPGVHQYRFQYQPLPFTAGLIISLLCLAIVLWLGISDTVPAWKAAWQSTQGWWGTQPFGRLRRKLLPQPVIVRRMGWHFEIARPGAAALEGVAVLGGLLFGLTLLVYLVTRFWGLPRFPIYFFSDEAIQTTLAADLIRDGFHNAAGDFLPTYFMNVDKYNLGFSVYLQVIPYLLFGKSVWVTRGISVLVSLLGVGAVSLTLKNIFRSRYWWSAGLLLSITPAWFLHSRTAFETVLMVSFYAVFLYCYLMYRYHNPRYLYAALIFGGLSFYSYSPGQVIVVLTGLLLFFSDIRYHWQQRKVTLRAVPLLLLIAVPYARFNWQHPTETGRNLQVLGSYWLQPIPLGEKIKQYLQYYGYGLSPAYWFIPNQHDLDRHLMKGYGHIFLGVLPLVLLGLLRVVRALGTSANRVLLIAVLVVPAGAALVGIGITRVLVMVIPAAILAALGVTAVLEWAEKRVFSYPVLAPAVFLILAATNFAMLSDALRNAPTWYQDYGLGGMQYGGEQLFSAVASYQKAHPDRKMLVSPSWANGTDSIERFFLSDLSSVSMGSVDSYLFRYTVIDPNLVFVMIPDEYKRVVESHKFQMIQVDQRVYYPNGQPGFYFVRLRYADNVQQIFEQEAIARQVLLEEDIMVNGLPAHVRFSRLDMGKIQDAFDGDNNSVIRTLEANPMVLDLVFPTPRTLTGIAVRVGAAATKITVEVYSDGASQPLVYQQQVETANYNRDVSLDFGRSLSADRLTVRVESVNETVPAHVHVWEVRLH